MAREETANDMQRKAADAIDADRFWSGGEPDSMTDILQVATAASDLAREKHAGQQRADGTPYFRHCAQVAYLAGKLSERYNVNPPWVAMVAGFLHDVLEDTDATAEYLLEQFGPSVSETVEVLTNDKSLPQPKRHEVYCRTLRLTADSMAHVVKLADLIDNARSPVPPERREWGARWAAKAQKMLEAIASTVGDWREARWLERELQAMTDPGRTKP